jgi:two-component system sensor kinase FixL
MEEQLAAGEEQYRNFIEQSFEGIWRLEFNQPIPTNLPAEEQVCRILECGYIAECNDAFAKMYGDELGKDVVGKRLMTLYGDKISEQNFQVTFAFVEAGYRGSHQETQEVNNKGELLYFLNSAIGIIEDDHLVAIWGTQQDITRLKQTDMALRESEEKYRVLIENINDVVFALDIHGNFTYISPVIERLSGYQADEIINQPSSRFVHPDDLADLMSSLEHTLTGQLKPFEFRVLGKEGEIQHVRTFSRVQQKEGQVIGLTGVMTDISTRKQIEEALQESEEKYRSIVENALTGIFTIDEMYRFIYANDELCRILGFARDEMIGMDFRQVLTKSSRDIVEERYVRRQRGEQVPPRYELELRRKDGELRHGEMSVTVVTDTMGRPRSMGQLADITERKRAEVSLRESEERYRVITELMSDYAYAYRVEPDGTFIHEWSTDDPVIRLTGYRPEEVGSSLILYHPDDQEKVERHVEQTIQGKSTSDEYRMVTKEGELRWVHISRQPVWSTEQNRVIRFYGIAQDITERKLAEKAVKDSEERYRIITELISDYAYAYRVEPDGAFSLEWITLEPAFRISGYDHRQEIGSTFKLYHPDDQEKAGRHVQETIEGNPTSGDYRIITKAGELRWLHIDRRPVWDSEEKRVVRFFGVAQDITERKLAEEAMRESEQKFRSIVEQASDIIAISDEQGLIVEWNRAAEQFLGRKRGDVIGKSFWEIQFEVLPEEERSIANRERFRAMGKQALQTGQVPWLNQLVEGEIQIPDGTRRHFQQVTFPIQTAKGIMLGNFARDVTDQKQAEAERELLIAELEAKNAELERFTYTVSHDLKSPLVTIKGFLGLLEKDVDKGDSRRVEGDIRHIRDAAEKMELLLDDLLELSRIGRLVNPPEAVNLDELAQEAAGLVTGQIAERGVQVDIDPDLPVVYGDRARLREVYQNLIQNAVKFMGEQPEPRVKIGIKEEDGEVIFYVRDNGIGIDPCYHDQVFGLFDRLDPGVEGTGIGLALVKRIIEVHGGQIWVESDGPNKGTTFLFTLPETAEEM